MKLETIKGVGSATATKLREAGIKNAEQLARADLAKLAEKSGISKAELRQYQERAVALQLMEDIKGIGPNTVVTLAESGVRNLRQLADASAERLSAELKVAKSNIARWQKDAQELLVRVREDSRTAEGRKKLVGEGKQLAQQTAERVQNTAQDVVEKAQKEGEVFLQKAKELQEQAPDKMKEAETRLRETRDKAEAFVKQEVEKVKAANEGLVERTRARLKKQG